jgi:hypothetical protein
MAEISFAERVCYLMGFDYLNERDAMVAAALLT